MQQLSMGSLMKHIGEMSPIVVGGVIVTFAFMLVFFLFTGRGLDFKKKVIGFFAVIIGFIAFVGFFAGGIAVGNMIGIGNLGALIGIAAFWGVFSLISYLRKPKGERGRRSY